MNTKTTIDDDEELSSRHSVTNSTSFCDSSCASTSQNAFRILTNVNLVSLEWHKVDTFNQSINQSIDYHN